MRLSSAVLALALAGCSYLGLEHNDPAPIVPGGQPEGILVVDLEAPIVGPSISVDEAVSDHLGGGPVLVRGALFIDDSYGTVWLCQEAMEQQGAPQPSCARPALLLQHPDAGGLQVSDAIADIVEAGELDELQELDGVRWTEDATFNGTIIDPLAQES